MIKIEMHFLPDVYVTCEVCKGKRYNRETLEVRYKGKNIADVLDMTVEEALRVLRAHPARSRAKLADPASTSASATSARPAAHHALGRRGAARQALRASSPRATGRTLYILDEPTTGLHFADVQKLLAVLQRAGRRGQHRGRDRAQPRRDQDRRLDHRPRPRGRRRRRPHRRRAARPRRSPACPGAYTGQYLRPLLGLSGAKAS